MIRRFSMVELLIVLAIVGATAAAVMTFLSQAEEEASGRVSELVERQNAFLRGVKK